MARAPRLKVYRTAIGFHDAYVAAPSQKAALEAWGARADLFARGVAERVDDPELSREPLAAPGTVIRRSRGTTAEQLAALPPDKPKREQGAKAEKKPTAKARSRPRPRPSRDALDEAERALEEADRRHEDALAEIADREAELARLRREAERDRAKDRDPLEVERDKQRDLYERAMTRWRG